MKKKNSIYAYLGIVMAVWGLSSCAEPNYLAAPTVKYPIIENIYSFGVQNMDESAKVENSTLTCHYEGFDVQYKFMENLVISMTIINNSNKSLIIDKSKCYVLYDGYATQLFKDVRSSRNTTFNNVQDAINNVQTNESGVSMTIPPYSKWELPLNETNVRGLSAERMPQFRPALRTSKVLTPFDENQEVVEFVIPYTYDYALAKWDTSRNRIFVNSVESVEGYMDWTPNGTHDAYLGEYRRKFKKRSGSEPEFTEHMEWLYGKYRIVFPNGRPDFSEANQIDLINYNMFKKHRRRVRGSHFFWYTITFPVSWWMMLIEDGEMVGCRHAYPVYGNRKNGN